MQRIVDGHRDIVCCNDALDERQRHDVVRQLDNANAPTSRAMTSKLTAVSLASVTTHDFSTRLRLHSHDVPAELTFKNIYSHRLSLNHRDANHSGCNYRVGVDRGKLLE